MPGVGGIQWAWLEEYPAPPAFTGTRASAEAPVYYRGVLFLGSGGSQHFGAGSAVGEGLAVAAGVLATDKPPRPRFTVILQEQETEFPPSSFYYGNIWQLQTVDGGQVALSGRAVVGASGTVITPTIQIGAPAPMVGEGIATAAAGLLQLATATSGGNASATATGNVLYGSPAGATGGNAITSAQGSGGTPVTGDDLGTSGIVAIGIRGGHS